MYTKYIPWSAHETVSTQAMHKLITKGDTYISPKAIQISRKLKCLSFYWDHHQQEIISNSGFNSLFEIKRSKQRRELGRGILKLLRFYNKCTSWTKGIPEHEASSLGLTHLQIELDAKCIVNILTNSQATNLLMEPLLSDCRSLLESFQNMKLDHVFREANQWADTLSKMGSSKACYFVSYSSHHLCWQHC